MSHNKLVPVPGLPFQFVRNNPDVIYLADRVGIRHVYAAQSSEDKLAIVREETARAKTLFVGDGINDAPALAAATVGLAFGQSSDITSEAAGAAVLDSSLERVDEFLHISRRMRSIALESAVAGMALSIVGMAAAAAGLLPPVTWAIAQEVIDCWPSSMLCEPRCLPRALQTFDVSVLVG